MCAQIIDPLANLMTTYNEPIKTEKLLELQAYFKSDFPEDYVQLLKVSDGVIINSDQRRTRSRCDI